jgi:asparagine synthase (glutamine-hydrolysing)
MCGLWASLIKGSAQAPVNPLSASAGVAAQMGLDAVSVRGPNGRKLISLTTPAGVLHMGHARLAIYDVSAAGLQPMKYGPLTLCFNGALYNFKEIRSELAAMGEAFHTQTDTEVLLRAWFQWGPRALGRIDGMFAGMIHDARTHSLTIFRDRFGEKPLHILSDPDKLVLASEINQIKAAGYLNRPGIDKAAAQDFLDLGLAEAGRRTFFKGVERLLAGNYRVYDLSGHEISQSKDAYIWAALPQAPCRAYTEPRAAAEATRAALELSIERRLQADVPIGSCLSGGLDSSAIVRLAAQKLNGGQVIHCFCASFDEHDPNGLNLSERVYAMAAANARNIKLHFVDGNEATMISELNAVLERQGEPFAHTSILAQARVFAQAQGLGIKVMLDGQGADELFGGYAGMLGHRLADILQRDGVGAWRQEVSDFGGKGADLDVRALRFATFNAVVPEALRRYIGRLRGRWPQRWQVTAADMSFQPPQIDGLSRFESLSRTLMTYSSLPSLLRYEDRNAMTYGIEARLPFLSRELVELAAVLPGCVKARAGWTKAVLRDAIGDAVPHEIVRRRNKLGFVTPQDRWMKGALGEWTRDGIGFAKVRLAGLLKETVVGDILDHLGQDIQANNIGFRLGCLGHWAERQDATLG